VGVSIHRYSSQIYSESSNRAAGLSTEDELYGRGCIAKVQQARFSASAKSRRCSEFAYLPVASVHYTSQCTVRFFGFSTEPIDAYTGLAPSLPLPRAVQSIDRWKLNAGGGNFLFIFVIVKNLALKKRPPGLDLC